MRAGWFAICLGLAACASDPIPLPGPEPEPEVQVPAGEAAYVEVDHILIGVANPKLPGVNRNVDEARQLADEIFSELRTGGDWDRLKAQHTDDRRPDGELGGPYSMANFGATPRHEEEAPRKGMVKSFGDVSFSLQVGEVGMAPYDPKNCKWGYHIIKRVK